MQGPDRPTEPAPTTTDEAEVQDHLDRLEDQALDRLADLDARGVDYA